MKKLTVKKTVSKGYAIGPAYKVERQDVNPDTASITADKVDSEIARFKDAVEKVQGELLELAAGNEIFAGHYALAGDIALHEGVVGKIRDDLCNAEDALMKTSEEFVMIFQSMDDEYMRERATDMKDVARKILMAEKGISDNPFAGMEDPSIIIAEDLTPSDTAQMDFRKVLGFLTAEGGTTSHVSIIAKNLGIPCLVGIGPEILKVEKGTTIAMAAKEGEIFIEPAAELLAEIKKKDEEFRKFEAELYRLAALPCETTDGHGFNICANAGNVEEVTNCAKYAIDGIGLFRSEFLYMESDHFPTEEEQFKAYREAAEILKGKELTIRTLDIGGDKSLSYFEFPREENPFLGYRAIRMCLDKQIVFKTQLRAILRASAFGFIRIMFPMVISVAELKKAKALLSECMKELKEEGRAFDKDIEIGIMVETPAAMIMADKLSKYVDFFSIGTNDLTQYVLAVDRGNKLLGELYNSFDPAVLRAIARTIEEGHKNNTKVGMCGEFASDPRASRILLGMGLDEFSMSPGETALVKYRLRGCSYEECRNIADKVLDMETAEEVMAFIGE